MTPPTFPEPVSTEIDVRRLVGNPDPYPLYARWRERGAVQRGRVLGRDAWLVLGYREAAELLRSSSVRRTTDEGLPATAIGETVRRWLVVADPEHHLRLRRLLARAFTPAALQGLRPAVERTARRLASRLISDRPRDFLTAFALPLPLVIIAEILGMPIHHQERLRRWSKAIAPMVEMAYPAPVLAAAERAHGEIGPYLRNAIQERRREPRDDLLTELARGAAEEGVNDADLAANCIFLLMAGHETTAQVLAMGAYHLLRRRELWERLVAEPDLARTGAAELIRYEPPVHLVLREVVDPIRVGEQRLREGERVCVFLGAANRDPDVFDEPDRLRLEREGPISLSFSLGPHFCLGAVLARMEVEIGLVALIEAVPDLRLVPGEEWGRGLVLRGLERLPVEVAGLASASATDSISG